MQTAHNHARPQTLKAPPPAGRSRKTNTLRSPVRPQASGGTGSGSLTLQYSLGLSLLDGDFLVTATVSPQVVGDNDWVGIFASQQDLQQCINNINNGGSGSNYQDWEWVSDFSSSNGTLTYESSVGATDGAVAAWFTKDFLSGRYVFVFATSPYQD